MVILCCVPSVVLCMLELTSMTATPVDDEPLTPDDANNVLEEIVEAQNQSYMLGLKLNLPLHVLDAIHLTNRLPRNRLLQVLIEFTKQVDPRPTWRTIVAALRSPAVNLPQLAMTVEAAHFPDLGKRGTTQSTAEDLSFQFVEEPSEDFFCPVTCGLLLQPHFTTCCRKHLSKEAATRIQEEGGACPLCKKPQFSTILDKQLRREVNKLHVFCHHKDRGCRWRGELSELERHVQSCRMKTKPDLSR